MHVRIVDTRCATTRERSRRTQIDADQTSNERGKAKGERWA
jgi:hypothetical protein